MMKHAVEVENLVKRFGDFTAVNSVSFNVEKGEIFGFLGPNGAGKSTTIRMLCGILTPTEGNGHVSGFDIVGEQKEIKNIIGYMSQKFSLYHDLTVMENLEFFGSIYGMDGKHLRKRIKYVVEMAEIGKRENMLVRNLPGGIKQRLSLGAAMLHDPQVLFLDEPTSGVDPIMRRNFWDLIYNFSKEGKTIFVTTHYMDEAEHCDRMALVFSGEIIAMDSPANLKKEMPYSVYSLEVQDFIRVFEVVNALDFVREAAIFGSNIHILADEKIQLASRLENELKRRKITNFSIKKIGATLEDVFVTYAANLK